MNVFLLCCGIVCVIYFNRISSFTKNPYTLKLIVGSKGSGKSLLLAQIANDFRGRVYSNMDIGYELEKEYWKQDFPQDSLIIIDEIGVIHSNRDFKSMPREAIEWYKMQRKRRLTVVVSSQTMDVDKKIRDLCDRIIVVNRYSFLCVARAYKAVIKMGTNAQGEEDLVNGIKMLGVHKIYSIPRAVRISEKVGYKTEQIISKEGVKNA